jgi:hypothetical protein
MNDAVVRDPFRLGNSDLPSLDSSDEFEELADPTPYRSMRLLAAFSLLMAGQGYCVSTAMMLGDRQYAMWQLARAHTTDDEELRSIAGMLFSYLAQFPAPQYY